MNNLIIQPNIDDKYDTEQIVDISCIMMRTHWIDIYMLDDKIRNE